MHDSAYDGFYFTPVVEHRLEIELAQWVTMRDRTDNQTHHERTSTTELPFAPDYKKEGRKCFI